jgi:hypothetical protein
LGASRSAPCRSFEPVQNWFEPVQNCFEPVQRLLVLEIRVFSAVLEQKWPLDRAGRSNLYRIGNAMVKKNEVSHVLFKNVNFIDGRFSIK